VPLSKVIASAAVDRCLIVDIMVALRSHAVGFKRSPNIAPGMQIYWAV
jgi:hypothetical protein